MARNQFSQIQACKIFQLNSISMEAEKGTRESSALGINCDQFLALENQKTRMLADFLRIS